MENNSKTGSNRYRIILVNHYAGSPFHGMEFRHYHLAKEWQRQGHEVITVAASFSHLRQKNKLMKRSVEHEMIDGLPFFWLKTTAYKGNGFGRVLNMLQFSLRLHLWITNFISNDKSARTIIIASSPHPFIVFGALKAARRSGGKLFFEVRDLWPLTLIELGNIHRFHPLVLLMQFTEWYAYRNADFTVSLLPAAIEYMVKKGLKRDKFGCIPNGISLDESNNQEVILPQACMDILENYRRERRCIIGFAGSYTVANDLPTLLQAMTKLEQDRYGCVLIGSGDQRSVLIELIKSLNITNVSLMDAIPKAAIPLFLKHIDIAYMGFKKSPLYRYGVSPNKLLDYMNAGKPVVYALDAPNDIVKEAKCGITVPPEDPGRLAEAIKTLWEAGNEEQVRIGRNGREYIKRFLSYDALAFSYTELFNQSLNLETSRKRI
jgi:glycosyltransferase involved in cell wall biosynthesis